MHLPPDPPCCWYSNATQLLSDEHELRHASKSATLYLWESPSSLHLRLSQSLEYVLPTPAHGTTSGVGQKAMERVLCKEECLQREEVGPERSGDNQ